MSSVFDSDAFNANCFFPRPDVSDAPPGAEDFQIGVDGASLHLRWHRTLDDAPTVLLFHGNGEVVSDYDQAAPEYARQRLNLAVCDFRGYGRSTGSPTLRSLISDVSPVVEFVAARTGPFLVMGRSLGSACALEVFALNDPRVAGVILESGFVDLSALVRRRGLTPPTSYTVEESRLFDARTKVPKGRAPLLIIHGEEDRAIDPDEAREAHRLATTSHKQLVLIPGRGHNDVSFSPAYWDALDTFAQATARRA